MSIPRPIPREITSSLTRPLTQPGAGGGGAFVPDASFFGASKGYAYDFTDTTKLFQLSNGTTPVTADSDPIGYVTDLSGNGRHGIQATAGNRPLYKTGLPRALFNGTSQFLAATGVDLSGTDKVTVIVACNLLTGTNRGLVGHGTTAAGDFNLLYSSGSASWRASLYGSTGNAQVTIATADKPTVPHTKVFSVVLDLAGATAADEIDWRMNGVGVAETVAAAGPAGGGNFANRTSEVGRASAGGSFFMDGSVYRIIVIGRELTVAELFNAEYWAGQAAGITILPEIPPAGEVGIMMMNSYGQSLSLGVSSTPPLSTTRRFSQDFMLAGGTEPWSPTPNYTSLVALAEDTKVISASDCGESPLSGMVELLHERSYTNETICVANGFPSLTIAQLSQGQAQYNINLATVTAAWKQARDQFKYFKVRAFTWMQGEGDGANNTYAANLNTLRGTLDTDIKAITKQTDDVWCLSYQLARAKIGLAQLDAQQTYSKIVIAAPTYQLPTADGVHLTNTSSKVMGAYFGLAYERLVVNGLSWKPLMCLSASYAGSVADLVYNPVGALTLDTTIVPSQTNSGFRLVDSGGSPLTISSVALLGSNQVRITAAAPIPAGAKVYYGFDDPTSHASGVAKGNLRDSQGSTIVFNGGGLNYAMHNWAVLQSVNL